MKNIIKTDKDELLIGLISDTHVPSRVAEVPQVIIDDFKKRNIDYIFHLGDFTSIKAYRQLLDIFGKEKFIAIIGNMDEGEIRDIGLPETLDFEIFGHKIFMTHGTGGPNIIIKRLNKSHDLAPYDIIIFGHSHQPTRQFIGGTLLFNPGRARNSFGLLTVGEEIKAEILMV